MVFTGSVINIKLSFLQKGKNSELQYSKELCGAIYCLQFSLIEPNTGKINSMNLKYLSVQLPTACCAFYNLPPKI